MRLLQTKFLRKKEKGKDVQWNDASLLNSQAADALDLLLQERGTIGIEKITLHYSNGCRIQVRLAVEPPKHGQPVWIPDGL